MTPGRRPKPPMRRTTSMNMFAGDIARQPADQEMLDPPHDQLYNHQLQQKSQPIEPTKAAALAAEVVYRKAVEDGGDSLGWPDIGVGDWLGASYMAPMLQPRGGRRRNSGDFAMLETGYFLRNCGFCKRRLGTAKDIFMYRGDIAFCSLECRQQQMNLDERKEKCSLTSMKETTAASSVSEQSTGDGTVIAA